MQQGKAPRPDPVIMSIAALLNWTITIDTHGLILPNYALFWSLLLDKVLDLLLGTLSRMGKKREKNKMRGASSKIDIFLLLNSLTNPKEKNLISHIFGL